MSAATLTSKDTSAVRDKYDLLISNILSKQISIERVIGSLKKNRTRLFLSDPATNATETVTSPSPDILMGIIDTLNLDEILLDSPLNNNFISHFLTQLHEEGNKFLPIRSTIGPSNLLESNDANESALNTTYRNFSAASSLSNTPQYLNNSHNGSFAGDRKITLRPLDPSPKSIYSPIIDPASGTPPLNLTNSVNASFGNRSNQRRSQNFTHISSSSPNCLVQKLQNNKMGSKPTLFDFITTPNKSPNLVKPNETPIIIQDFKNRFHQHQQQMQQQQQQQQLQQQQQSPQPKPAEPAPEKAVMDETKRKQYDELGATLKQTLTQQDMSRLSTLAKFYSQLILNNFILTINTELFFIFQLLTLNAIEDKTESQNESGKLRIFSSIESCIYFAINAMKELQCMLKHLKGSTLMELKENIYIKSFPNLFEPDSAIMNHELSKEEIKSKSKFVLFELKQVPFNTETNYRDNFQDKSLFILSKNQRDVFYDILWQWEKHHKLENWNFAEQFGEKIRYLVSFSGNITSFFQFTKLFQEQLVLMCKDDRMLIDNKDDEINGPDHIKASCNIIKLKQLNARMSTPKPNYGPNPTPKFIGYQEFFKEFIDLSSSPMFHQSLKDILTHEIEMVHKEIPDVENGHESSIDKEAIEDMLLRLRIMGKFLGYLVFYPYNYSISSFLVKELVLIRNTSQLPINIQGYIERGIAKKHLILTVPFVVEFLSMMDENAYLIDSIQHAISSLVMIFNSQQMLIKSENFTIEKLLVLFCISWLLQLKKLPSNQLKVNENLQIEESKVGLDNFNIVMPLLLHFCCPYLDELHKLLTRFSTGVKRAVHKIKDVSNLFSFELVRDMTGTNKQDPRYIQMQLMAKFLFLHPNKKRLVEFVSESVVTSFVKTFRNSDFKVQLSEMTGAYMSLLAATTNAENAVAADTNTDLESTVSSLSAKYSESCRRMCREKAQTYFKNKIEIFIENSLEKNESAYVKRITSQITEFKAIEKLKQWISINLNEGVFYEELKWKRFKRRNDQLTTEQAKMSQQEQQKPSSNQQKSVQQAQQQPQPTQKLSEQEAETFRNLEIKPSGLFNSLKLVMKQMLLKQIQLPAIEREILQNFENILKFSKSFDNSNKFIIGLKQHLAILASEIMLIYEMDKENQSPNPDIIELYYQIELGANDKNHLGILERLLSNRNQFIFKEANDPVVKENYSSLIQNLVPRLNLAESSQESIPKLMQRFFTSTDR